MSDSDDPPSHQTLLDVLEWRAAQQPDGEAYTFLIDGESREASITYGELYRRACAIGAQLQNLGAVGERALILCPAGLDYIAAFFGCICSGWAAVPLYAPNLGEHIETIRMATRTSESRAGITTSGMMPGIREIFADIPELAELCWIMADDTPTGSEARWQRPDIGPESLAYLVFTSGSTSAPKGVPKKHKNLRLTPLESIRHDGTVQERIVDWTSPSTTTGLTMAFVLPVCAGMPCTLIAPEAVLERPARWIEAMSRTRATRSTSANFALDLAVDAVPPEDRVRLDLSCWEWVATGGEQVRAETIERFETAFAISGLRRGAVSAGYGMTEAARMVQVPPGQPLTAIGFDRAQLEAGHVVPLPDGSEGGRMLVGLGIPNPGVEIVIVNPATHTPCAPDEVGEIWTAGSHVSDGYWRAPEATRDAFQAYLADTGWDSEEEGCAAGDPGAGPYEPTTNDQRPTTNDPKAGAGPYFRTGDLGFFHRGELFITGRLKDIIIIRGRNIPATDIELAARHSHPATQNEVGAAFAIEVDGAEQLAIVQEVAETDEYAAIAETIRRAIATEIGVQTHTVALAPHGAIPRTRGGKLQRAACRAAYLAGQPASISGQPNSSSGQPDSSYRALPLLFVSAGTAGERVRRTPHAPPTTDVERTLVAIWERVLNLRPIGIHDTFVDLGGDSLSSVQVLLGIREAGLPVTPRDIHQHGTIAALATAIASENVVSRPSTTMLHQDAGPAVGPVPLTSNQYWLLSLGEQRPAWTVTATILQATMPLLTGLLDQTLQHLMFHHDALRLRCVKRNGGWVGEYAAHTPGRLVSVCDLTPTSRTEAQLHRQVRTQRIGEEVARLRASIDVERGPLIRLGRIYDGDIPDLVVLCLSHIVMDGVSTGILIRDLNTVYAQLARGEEPRLPPRTSPITAWAQRAAAFARSDAMREEVGYWRHVMSHGPTRLPMSTVEETPEPGQDQILSVHLGPEQTAALQRLGRLGLGLSEVVHYAVAHALSEEVGTASVSFLTMSHGRSSIFPDIDLSRTIGWLAQWIPLRLDVGATPDHVADARAIGLQMREMPHHGMGYGILRRYADPALRAQVPDMDLPIRLNFMGNVNRFSGVMAVFSSAPEWDDLMAQEAEKNVEVPWHLRIEITVRIAQGDLQCEITYHDRAYCAETIERFAGRIVDVLTEMVSGM